MDKFDELFKLSNRIIDGYIDLLINPIYEIDQVMCSNKVEMILDMIIEKYKLIHTMNKDELNYYINKIDVDNKSDRYECIIRIRNKLVDYKEVLNGLGVTTSMFGLSKINFNMEVSLYDAILSMINIEVIKLLKDKIYSLKANCDDDEQFIELLKQRLKVSKIELLFNTGLSEIMALYYNTNIEDIPRINIDVIKNIINNNQCGNLIQNTIVVFLANNVKELSKIRYVKNNDKEVFKYLVSITQIEVLLDYLDKNKLNELYEFCNKMTNNDNIASMKNIKRLVKRKMID